MFIEAIGFDYTFKFLEVVMKRVFLILDEKFLKYVFMDLFWKV